LARLQNSGDGSKDVTRPIVLRFGIALGVLTGIGVAAAALVYLHFQETKLLAAAVTDSGRQRVLIVQASDLVTELSLETSEGARLVLQNGIARTAEDLADARVTVVQTREQALLVPNDDPVPELGAKIASFVGALKSIARAPPPAEADAGGFYRPVLLMADELLRAMARNQAVWEADAMEQGRHLLVLEWVMIAASAAILWGMAIFAFLPLWRRVRWHVRALEELNATLESRVKERTAVLQEREERFQAIFEQAAVGIVILTPDGRYLDANDAFCRIVGYEVDELRQRTYRDITCPEDLEHDLLQQNQMITGEIRTGMAEKRYLRKGGIPVWTSRAVSVVRKPTGEADYVIAVVKDISDRKRAEEEMRLAKEEAETASRSKTAFLANMSHELRTPLNAIIGFSEIIEGQVLGPIEVPHYVQYARNILDAGRHLLELINEILDMSRIEAGAATLRETEVDVKGIVESVVRLMGEGATAARLRMTTQSADDLPWLIADERHVRQVLFNLLSNAVKFTPAGGSIALTAGLTEQGDLSLSVADTGVGIADEDIPKVLRPFGQAENSLARRYEGVGLGLSIAKSLVELHGGRLSLESTVGVGTVVTAIFPADRVRPPAPPADAARQQPPAQRAATGGR
jgi:PAS domain S-box-containing protein